MSVLDEKQINKIVEKVVAQEIASKLGNPVEYLEKLIKNFSGMRVNKYDGRECYNKNDRDGIPYIEWVADKCIVESVKKIIYTIIAEKHEELKSTISDKLKSAINKSDIFNEFSSRVLSYVNSENFSIKLVS